MISNGRSARHSSNVLVLEKCANIDYKYGPYASTAEAFEFLDDLEVLSVGLTVGILIGGKIVEYWFESACSSASDLVVKQSSSDGETLNQILQGVTNIQNRMTVQETAQEEDEIMEI